MDTNDKVERGISALWVAGTGAFLLVAAAATFVAVRWEVLPDVLKLAIVVGTTALAMGTGRVVSRRLPTTGGVLFHLGAFLVPVDVAAVGLHADLSWPTLLVTEGLVLMAVWSALARWSSSVVLEWAAMGAGVVLASGVAALGDVPTPLLLGGAAVAADLAGARRPALLWSLLTGLAPVMGIAEATTLPGRDVLIELGLSGPDAASFAAVSGVLAAVVLVRAARRRLDPVYAVLAGVSLVVGIGTTWVSWSPAATTTAVGLAAVFVLLEVSALLLRRDPFWCDLAGLATVPAELLAALAALPAAAIVLVAPWLEAGDAEPVVAAALGLSAIGWAVAGARRWPASCGASTPLAALCLAAALAAGTASGATTGVALAAMAGVGALLPRRPHDGVAIAAGLWAPVAAIQRPSLALAIGAVSALALAIASVRRQGIPGWARLGVAAVATGVGTPLVLIGALEPVVAITWAVVSGWCLALLLDEVDHRLGHLARGAALAAGAGAVFLSSSDGLVVSSLVVGLGAFEAVRRDEAALAIAVAPMASLAVADAALLLGLGLPATGLTLCLAAAVVVGAAGCVSRRWAGPLLTSAATHAGVGLVLATLDLRTLGHALLVLGATALGAGVTTRQPAVAHAGGALLILGAWANLTASGVAASEPYLAPVALHLLVAGLLARRRDDQLSSWTAYGPGVGLLGGSALAERLAGGPGEHALVAGAVAVLAVLVGGWRRLAAPLVIGTAILLVLATAESLAYTADIPTWAWLATAGTVLLTGGVLLERSGASPLEAGHRVVDVVRERFS